ncbi:carboxylesterase/lipase family protein [Streptomyces sp. NBC_01803]|uniref:carboxylesterase/lipase family protein n=1 Tax=Streptomyces sp. NBC_01803 TaxID=2975946 RepID=UPI002DD9D230|nr:carboxylesterase family protein [Streptomyces sp. NBC_01803]WSA43036.1 carboxylesterase family protein [Streptomyces sp. NBC_01803]
MELPIAQTTHGAVRGRNENGVSSFKGIPYAAPLDGPARFAAPGEPERWDGVREAHRFSSDPPQVSLFPDSDSAWSPGDSADCLSVNVWTPDPGGRGLPVMVWIYGGAYILGTSRASDYDGANLARGGVVVVTLNYRVGFEGFGWLPDAPRNRALLDQLAALRWVRENIAAFGGDPDTVTLFGESAGAASIAALTAAEAGRGLFRRAIGQSVASGFQPEERARRAAERIAGALGVPATAEAFGQVASEAIHAVQSVPGMLTPFGPLVGGDDLVPDLPWRRLRAEVDLIAGFNRDEYTLFALLEAPERQDPVVAAERLGLPAGAVAEYRAARPGISDQDLYVLIMSDGLFRMPSLWSARNHPGRSWCYELTWATPALGGALRVCHALDVPLVFGNLTGRPLGQLLLGDPAPAEAETLSKEIRRAWTSFATTGDPGWPEYRAGEALTRVWDLPVSVVSDPEAVSRRIWESAG